MMLTPLMKSVVLKSHTKAMENEGVSKHTLDQALTNGYKVEKNYGYRQGTSLFFDWGIYMGLNDREVREPLQRMRPSVREVIDFYNQPRCTTLGAFPFQTLFLECEWRRYGLTLSTARRLEADVKANLGAFGYAMLIDTMNFVMTGERDVPISLLLSYMDDDVSSFGPIVQERFDRKELSKLSHEEFLSKWISTEKGMCDCIEMLRLVFNIDC